MAATCLYIFLILLLAQVITQQEAVYVPTVDDVSHSSHDDLLEHYLCNDTVSSTLSNTTLLLSTTGAHTLHRSCVVKGVSGLIIASNSSKNAIINCTTSLGGVVFYNVTELAINSIHIVNCSVPLPTDIAKYDNKSTFYFGPGQRSAFYFSNCENISIDNMSFDSVSGLSLLVVNSFGAVHINNVAIVGSNIHCENISYTCAGSGMAFYYHNHAMMHASASILPTANISVNNCNFSRNNAAYFPPPHRGLCYTQGFDNHYRYPLLTAAGLSFLFTQNSSNISVSIDEGSFMCNTGLVLLNIFNNLPGLSDVFIQNTTMANNIGLNKELCCSSAIHIVIDHSKYDIAANTITDYRPFKIYSVSILNHHTAVPAVYIIATNNDTCAMHVRTYLVFEFFNCINTTKFDDSGGGCLTAEAVERIFFSFVSVTVLNKLGRLELSKMVNTNAAFIFINIHQVIIEGSETRPSNFSYNYATAIQAYDTRIILNGTVVFKNNRAIKGGAMCMYDSYLILTEGTNMMLVGNTAILDGAAIYAYNTPSMYSNSFCVIQFYTNLTNPIKMEERFNLIVQNNTVSGKRGLNISVSPAYNCAQFHAPHIESKDLKDVYNNITSLQNAIRSTPAKVGLCMNGRLSYGEQFLRYTYPGVPINLSVAAVDLGNNIVPGEIIARVASHSQTEVFGLYKPDVIKSFSHTDYCANYTYRIFKCHYNANNDNGQLLLFTENNEELLTIPFEMCECPLGYTLSNGVCQCNDFVKSLPYNFNCSIDHVPLKFDHYCDNCTCTSFKAMIACTVQYGWMGYDHTKLIYTVHCPIGFCELLKSVDLFHQDGQCAGNRRGQVCSECKPGYSAVFGTKHCMKCSNMWLLTILLYAILGILLVLFLYITHFTIDQGTVVGIVLFANLAMFVLSQLYDRSSTFGLVETFISMLNFDIGVSLCFYDGMTDVVKTALQFAFPIYVWGIVILVIVISNRSTYVANLTSGNSVQVLITLVHFSFVKILRNVILIFTPLKLYRMTDNSSSPYEIDYVWYGNATIPYGGTVEHCLLLVAGSVVTIGFLLPYVVMSFAAPYCLRYRLVNHFRQVYETQYGPYKDNYRYWFGVRLLLLVVFSIVYVFTEGTRIDRQLAIYSAILIVFFLLQGCIKPFKATATYVIDSFYVGTATAGMCAAAYFSLIDEGYSAVSLYIGKAIYSLIFIMFVVTVIYHFAYFVTPVNSCLIWKRLHLLLGHRFRLRNMIGDGQANNYGATIQRSYNDSSYREPLLSWRNT